MQCLEYIRNLLEYVIGPEGIAAVIIEPITGEGGYMVPFRECFFGLKKIWEGNEIFFIADEVQTRYGRAGSMFAVDDCGVRPDVVTLAKSVPGRFPLSATIDKKELMDRWEPGVQGSILGGHPVSCAAAHAVVDTVT